MHSNISFVKFHFYELETRTDYYRVPPTYLLPWDSLMLVPITFSSEEVKHVIELVSKAQYV